MEGVTFLRVLCFIAVLVCYSPSLVNGDCTASSDCNDDECCLSSDVFKGRRQVAGNSCVPRATIGSSCYVNNDALLDSDATTVYYNGCPCTWNARCRGTGQFEVPQGEIGVCQGILTLG